MISPGLKVVLAYLLITYLLPCLYNTFFDLASISSYHVYPVHGWALTFVLAFSLLLIFYDRRHQYSKPTPPLEATSLPIAKLRFFISIGCCLGAVLGYVGGLSDFRYASDSAFAGRSILVYLLAIIPNLLKFDFLYLIFFHANRDRHDARLNALTRIFVCGAFLFSINGTASALYSILYLFYAFAPNAFVKQLTKSTSRRKLFATLLVVLSIAVVTVALSWILGETIKRGGDFENTKVIAFDATFLAWFFHWVMERCSSSYFSLLMVLDQHLLQINLEPLKNLYIPFQAIIYRLNILFGQPFFIMKPEISSICRLNYLLTTIQVAEREGTSPGLIGGFILCFPFPLSIITLVVYSASVIKLLNSFIGLMPRVPNLIGLVLIAWFFLPFFESPIDLLILIDDTNVTILLTLTFVYFKLRNQKRKLSSYKRWAKNGTSSHYLVPYGNPE